MVSIRMWGGLGNQLFLYALYEKMLSLGKETYICLDKHCYDYYRQMGLSAVYQLPLLNLNPVESPESERLRRDFMGHGWYYLAKRRVMRAFGRICREKENGKFDPDILRKDNTFLEGYFQTERYFEDIGGTIRNKVHFEGANDAAYSELLKEMRKDNSVSIHVRLTDYAANKVLGGICNADYYRKSIEKIKERVSNPVFYLFSDDLDTAGRMLSEYNAVPVHLNRGPKLYLDMFLMSQCKNNIIANSSFSWWGAWLNPHDDKIVIAPSLWFRTDEAPDICPESWIRV